MHKLDSIWYHEAPKNGKLASSHIAVAFCALAICKMVDNSLMTLQFDGIPSDLSDRSLSPLDYCLAYTDGEILDVYIKPKYRKDIVDAFDSNKLTDIMFELPSFEHDNRNQTYTLKCSWHNVDTLAAWLSENIK